MGPERRRKQPSQRRFVEIDGELQPESDRDFAVREVVSDLPLVRQLGDAPIQVTDLRGEEKKRSVVDPRFWNE